MYKRQNITQTTLKNYFVLSDRYQISDNFWNFSKLIKIEIKVLKKPKN